MTSLHEHTGSMEVDGSTAVAENLDQEDLRAFSQTLDRGLQVLDLIADSPNGITVKEITERLGVHRTNVTRLLHTLNHRRYIRRTAQGAYCVGPHLFEMVQHAEPPLLAVASSVLQLMADKLGATTHLTVSDGDDALALKVIEPRTGNYHVSYRPGTKRPLSMGASGYAILATRPPTSADLPEVRQARKQGWTSSAGQLEQGTWGIATSIPHSQYREYSIGAIYLGEPLDTIEVAREVLGAASEISRALSKLDAGHD